MYFSFKENSVHACTLIFFTRFHFSGGENRFVDSAIQQRAGLQVSTQQESLPYVVHLT